jgi:hypothetical protein
MTEYKITTDGSEIRCTSSSPASGHRTWIYKGREFFSCRCDHNNWAVCRGHMFGHEEPLIPVASADVPPVPRALLLAAGSFQR